MVCKAPTFVNISAVVERDMLQQVGVPGPLFLGKESVFVFFFSKVLLQANVRMKTWVFYQRVQVYDYFYLCQ